MKRLPSFCVRNLNLNLNMDKLKELYGVSFKNSNC